MQHWRRAQPQIRKGDKVIKSIFKKDNRRCIYLKKTIFSSSTKFLEIFFLNIVNVTISIIQRDILYVIQYIILIKYSSLK